MSLKFYATGRRKRAVARVYITQGTGKIAVNRDEVLEYFKRATLKMQIEQPLQSTNLMGQIDITAYVHGGGLSGQAGALLNGLAKALVKFNPEFRKILRDGGFMTRDSRIVERKKYGLAKARKRFQYSKR
jgi:small subunit ribosomal protein S9